MKAANEQRTLSLPTPSALMNAVCNASLTTAEELWAIADHYKDAFRGLHDARESLRDARRALEDMRGLAETLGEDNVARAARALLKHLEEADAAAEAALEGGAPTTQNAILEVYRRAPTEEDDKEGTRLAGWTCRKVAPCPACFDEGLVLALALRNRRGRRGNAPRDEKEAD